MKLIQYDVVREGFINSRDGKRAILVMEGIGEPVTTSMRDVTRVYHLDQYALICSRLVGQVDWRVGEILIRDTGHIVDRLSIERETEMDKHITFAKE